MLLEELYFVHGLLRQEAQDVWREVLQVREAPLDVLDVSVDGLVQDALAVLYLYSYEIVQIRTLFQFIVIYFPSRF